jgi:hypothetical protein
MAIVPISQPLAPGLLAADYSPWSPEAGARSGLFGRSGFLDYTHPTGLTGYTPDITPPTWSAPGGPMVSDVEPVEGVGSGLPMPDVEGYKYVYPKYSYDREGWNRSGYSEDRDDYDYYPYWPTDLSGGGPILVGVELRKE